MNRKPKLSPERPQATSVAKAKTLARRPAQKNLPAVSKQTAGGIAGAMVGNSSAHGERPIGKVVDNLRAVTEKPVRRAYAHISEAMTDKKTPPKDLFGVCP